MSASEQPFQPRSKDDLRDDRDHQPRAYRMSSVMADAMADTLFDQEAPLQRHVMERRIITQIRLVWQLLRDEVESGARSMASAKQVLATVDRWADGKLSGRHVLTLARDAEEYYREWIPMMPKVLGSRYEELRVARLWSALLNPEALSRLRIAIETERSLGSSSDSSSMA